MSSARRPDVIVVVLEGARAFDVSAVWAGGPETTPRLAGLAAESLVFRQATTTSPWSLPARASLLTGLMPSRHGANERTPVLAAGGAPTLAELLGAEGYATVAVTSGGRGQPDTGLTRGYARALHAGEPQAAPRHEGGIAGRLAAWRRRQPLPPAAPPTAGAAAHVEAALLGTGGDRPLHLLVDIAAARLPYRPPDDDAQRYLDTPSALAAARALDQDPDAHLTGATLHTESDWRLLRALYRAAIRHADAQLGQVLDALAAAGRLDSSLLLVVADHGENLGDHGSFGHHHSLNDTVLRVPLVVRLPGATQRGERDDLAQLLDVLPTACEVAGIAAPATQGASLTMPLPRSHAVAEYAAPHPHLGELMQQHPHVDWTRYDRGLRSIRTAERKYVSATDGGNELYDLVADPYERDNLFGGHPDEVAMARALRRWEQDNGAAPLSGVTANAAVTERLRALGYIE